MRRFYSKAMMRRFALLSSVLFLTFGLLFLFGLTRPILSLSQRIEVKTGESFYHLFDSFQGQNFSKLTAKLYLKLRDIPLQQGEYELREGTSWFALIHQLSSGEGKIYYEVMLTPGMTNQDLFLSLNGQDFLSGAIPYKRYKEGSFLPQTYYVERGETRSDLLKRMAVRQREVFISFWQARAAGLPFKTIESAIIFASIVEKEAAFEDERALIASVYLNRLKKNMRLQADPTLIYGLTKMRGYVPKKLYYKDLKIKTPYNSYLYPGLPPSPIANPGLASFKASLDPAKTNYLYFVLDPKSGHHLFSQNFKCHRQKRKLAKS